MYRSIFVYCLLYKSCYNDSIISIQVEEEDLLYDRDYNQGPTDEEKQAYKDITGFEFGMERESGRFCRVVSPLSYPKAIRLYMTIFPNNYMDFVDLRDCDALQEKNTQFLELLNKKDVNERIILNHIKETSSYHIIGAILNGIFAGTGHHGLYLFPEFQLGNAFTMDYLMCARSSGGYEFFLVELENPNGDITLKTGELGSEFRDGISQLRKWNRFLQSSYSAFTDTLKKYKNPTKDLSDEFYTFDISRFHYIVVAGRRSNFAPLTYAIKRELKKSDDITLLHYDNLVDYATALIGKVTY